MINDFERALSEFLAPARMYLGEFEDKSAMHALFADNDVLVLLDFVRAGYIDAARQKLDYKLLFCARTSSKALTARMKCKSDVLAKLREVDEKLRFAVIDNASITLGELVKEYEAASELGYIALYSRSFSAELNEAYKKGYFDAREFDDLYS